MRTEKQVKKELMECKKEKVKFTRLFEKHNILRLNRKIEVLEWVLNEK